MCTFPVAGRCISHCTLISSSNKSRGRRGRDRMDLQPPVQSVPITTKVVSLRGVFRKPLCDQVCQ